MRENGNEDANLLSELVEHANAMEFEGEVLWRGVDPQGAQDDLGEWVNKGVERALPGFQLTGLLAVEGED